jgi:hypothetical protein
MLSPQNVTPFTELEIAVSVRKLKRNKASDSFGLTSEHLIMAQCDLTPIMTMLFNAMLKCKLVPTIFKIGLLLPLIKKLKSKRFPTNYRGITIISVIGKLLEFVMLLRIINIFTDSQARLQRGFTEKIAPLYAGLILCEVIHEYEEEMVDLTVVMLDAEKAFDRVWHDGLFRKLYNLGMPLSFWSIMREWYRGFNSQVRWLGHFSCPFEVQQGTIQGGGLSPHVFKIDMNDQLVEVQNRHLGATIGTINCAVPTCADDVAVICPTSSTDGDLILDIVACHAKRDRRGIQNSKSAQLYYHNTNQNPMNTQLYYDKDPLPIKDTATHIGILQGPIADLNRHRVDKSIATATKTLYGLFGAGLHGKNGFNPSLSADIWHKYILSSLLFGAELWMLDPLNLERLEVFQRQKLRQLQGLPPRTASAACLGLLGIWPIEAEIDRRVLGLFRNIIDNESQIEYDIAVRQLATKPGNSNSWFAHVNRTLQKYILPNAHELLQNPPSKQSWKRTVKQKITQKWEAIHKEESQQKPSLRYLSDDSLNLRKPALIWESSSLSLRETHKAFLKAKIVTGTYTLQAHQALFNKRISPTCKLCLEGVEDRVHFLLKCSALSQYRTIHLAAIAELLETTSIGCLPSDENIVLQLLLDPTHDSIQEEFRRSSAIHELEKLSRNMCFHLHICRWKLVCKLDSQENSIDKYTTKPGGKYNRRRNKCVKVQIRRVISKNIN